MKGDFWRELEVYLEDDLENLVPEPLEWPRQMPASAVVAEAAEKTDDELDRDRDRYPSVPVRSSQTGVQARVREETADEDVHRMKEEAADEDWMEDADHQVDQMEDVDRMKERYIVGKRAGEDVYDSTGHMIVARNTVITREVIRQAEQEGKLVDLIVNMVIPGLGDV